MTMNNNKNENNSTDRKSFAFVIIPAIIALTAKASIIAYLTYTL